MREGGGEHLSIMPTEVFITLMTIKLSTFVTSASDILRNFSRFNTNTWQ